MIICNDDKAEYWQFQILTSVHSTMSCQSLLTFHDAVTELTRSHKEHIARKQRVHARGKHFYYLHVVQC